MVGTSEEINQSTLRLISRKFFPIMYCSAAIERRGFLSRINLSSVRVITNDDKGRRHYSGVITLFSITFSFLNLKRCKPYLMNAFGSSGENTVNVLNFGIERMM